MRQQQQPTNDNRGVGALRGGAGQHGGGGHNNIGSGGSGGGGGSGGYYQQYPHPNQQQFHPHPLHHPQSMSQQHNAMNNAMNNPQHHNQSNINRPPPHFPHSQSNPNKHNYDYTAPPPPHHEHGYPYDYDYDYPSQQQQPPHHPHYNQHNHHACNANVPFNIMNHKPNQTPTYFQQCTPLTRTISHYKRISQIGEGTYGQVYSALSLDQPHNPHSPKTIVALKKIRLAPKEENGLPRNVIREIKILKGLHHENMVKMIEVVSSKGYEYLDEEDERKDDKRKRLKLEQQQQNQLESNNMDKDSYKTSTNNNDNDENNTNNPNNNYKGNLFLVLEYISHDLSGILDMGHRFTPVQSKYIFHQLLSVLQYMHSQNYVHRDLKSSNILLQSDFKVKLADFGLARCMDNHES
jgi:hypothetical protein